MEIRDGQGDGEVGSLGQTQAPVLDSSLPPPKADIAERTVAYALRVIRVCQTLERTGTGRVLGRQLLRSGTSIGANVQEAQGGQSRADFIAKLSIAHKEARESAYWLRLMAEAKLVPAAKLAALRDESDQLIRILASILLSSKGRVKN